MEQEEAGTVIARLLLLIKNRLSLSLDCLEQYRKILSADMAIEARQILS